MNTASLTDSQSFYDDLTPFGQFDQLADDQYYASMPDDHFAVVADIRGSTQAVKDGKYKDVNFVGAATITSLISALDVNFPFVFGGDGASVVVHESQVDKTEKVLRTLAYYATEIFDLTLSVGLVPVPKIKAAGYKIDVAKYQPDNRMPLAMFRGGGLQYAEQLVKEDSNFQLEPAPLLDQGSLFAGLTCRWENIVSSNGLNVSLLVSPMDEDNAPEQIREVVAQIACALGGSFDSSNPITPEMSGYRSFTESLREELRYYSHWSQLGYLNRVMEMFIAIPVFKWGLYKHFKWAQNYINGMGKHADFQKFDDILRMVIDCKPKQIEHIRCLLDKLQDDGKIVYGMHTSESAQMTCFVQGIEDGEHIHFIDGSNGGYTLAAAEMKKRLAERT